MDGVGRRTQAGGVGGGEVWVCVMGWRPCSLSKRGCSKFEGRGAVTNETTAEGAPVHAFFRPCELCEGKRKGTPPAFKPPGPVAVPCCLTRCFHSPFPFFPFCCQIAYFYYHYHRPITRTSSSLSVARSVFLSFSLSLSYLERATFPGLSHQLPTRVSFANRRRSIYHTTSICRPSFDGSLQPAAVSRFLP
jgi:hypothetical protein